MRVVRSHPSRKEGEGWGNPFFVLGEGREKQKQVLRLRKPQGALLAALRMTSAY
jgi:hypothetical protein